MKNVIFILYLLCGKLQIFLTCNSNSQFKPQEQAKLLHGILKVRELQKASPASFFADLSVIRYRRQTIDDEISCILPPHPKNGRWIVLHGSGNEGDIITVNTLLEFHCKKGYKLSSRSPYVVCDKNWNTKTFPECLKLCPLIQSTITTTVKCVNKNGKEIGCHEATEESYLTYTCADFYEAPFGYKTTFFCSDGDWNSPRPICQPVCGKSIRDDAKPLIFGGKVEKVIEYPWIAVIYKKEHGEYMNICGGSILSQKLVLTAAHCVANNYGDALPEENYLVAAGKLHNRYNDSRDPHAQYLNVLKIVVHPTYKGDSRRYLGDIAIIVTKESFVLNKFVEPVCFSDVKSINLQVGTVGVVAGFGIEEEGVPSEKLRTLEIPYKSEATCAKELPGDWGNRYNVIDKLCAGYYNQNMSICPGDSGNGLFFKNPENSRYYVHGVVSLGISKKGQCDIQQNSLYTKVSFHYEFLDRQITKYYVKDCSLPPYPENGKWVAEIENKKPGDTVPSDTLLKISCDEGYRLFSDSPYIRCESFTNIMPTCQRLCQEVRLPSKIDYSCTSKEGEAVSCNEATDYTTLTFNCPSGYKIAEGSKNTMQCLNGTWEAVVPKCELIKTSKEDAEETGPYLKVICVYDSRQYDNGVKPEDLDATLCSHVIYDSVGLTSDGNLRVELSSNKINSYRSVADMKNRNKELKAMLSVYGSGSKSTNDYPVVAADPVKRVTFVASVTKFLETYGYDGLNVHWITILEDDQDNYLELMRDIKEAFSKRAWLLSATVHCKPVWFAFSLSAVIDTVDWFNLESYGFYSEWSNYTGQNSALYSSSLESDYEKRNHNFDKCVYNWYSSGEDKISPTIAFFGRYFTLKDPRRHGLRAPVTGFTDSNHTGPINYSEICEKFRNWTRLWHSQQKNPYKYHKNKWVGYDDKTSVRLKAEYVMLKGLSRVTVYPVDGDDVFGICGPKQVLLKSVYAGLGEPVDSETENVSFCDSLE